MAMMTYVLINEKNFTVLQTESFESSVLKEPFHYVKKKWSQELDNGCAIYLRCGNQHGFPELSGM